MRTLTNIWQQAYATLRLNMCTINQRQYLLLTALSANITLLVWTIGKCHNSSLLTKAIPMGHQTTATNFEVSGLLSIMPTKECLHLLAIVPSRCYLVSTMLRVAPHRDILYHRPAAKLPCTSAACDRLLCTLAPIPTHQTFDETKQAFDRKGLSINACDFLKCHRSALEISL